jgi:hypothetical protein
MADAFTLGLGTTARDVVTGFEGVVVARAQHLTGCNTYGLMKKADDKGDISPEARWFDEQRLVAKGKSPIVLPTAQPEQPVRRRGAIANPQPTRTVGR